MLAKELINNNAAQSIATAQSNDDDCAKVGANSSSARTAILLKWKSSTQANRPATRRTGLRLNRRFLRFSMRAKRQCETAPEVHRRSPTLANDAISYCRCGSGSKLRDARGCPIYRRYANPDDGDSQVCQTVMMKRHREW